jgi:hypothetical protein
MITNRPGRKLVVGFTGGVTFATGLVLMPLPGPGTVIALAGLSILSREFPAARRLLDRIFRRRPSPTFKDPPAPADPSSEPS